MSIEFNHRALLVLRIDNAAALQFRGDIISILPASQFVGNKVDKRDQSFSIIYVVDLPSDLEDELLSKVKKLIVPTTQDPMYSALISKDDKAGNITVDTATLLNYIEMA